MKRFVSMLLALSLLLSCFALPAMADELDGELNEVEEIIVAEPEPEETPVEEEAEPVEEIPAAEPEDETAAAETPTDPEAPAQSEPETPAVEEPAAVTAATFENGYVRVKDGAKAYKAADDEEEAGEFEAASVVYAEMAKRLEPEKESWLKVTLDTQALKESDDDPITVYVQWKDVAALTADETDELVEELKKDWTVRSYKGNALPLVKFSPKAEPADRGSAPVIVTQPESVTTPVNTTVTFTVTATGATSYRWQTSKDGGSTWSNISATSGTFSGATTNELTFTMKPAREAEQYRCVLKNSDGTTETNTVTATIGTPAAGVIITTQPVSVTTPINSTVTFTVVAENATSYQWQISKNSGETWSNISATSTTFSGADTNELSFLMKSNRQTEQYRCNVIGASDSKTTDVVTATVGTAPVTEEITITTQPQSVTTTVGATVTFTVVAENVTKYQWQSSKDGSTWSNISASSSTFSGSNTDTLTFMMKTARLVEQYRCLLTGANGSVPTEVVTVSLPAEVIIVQQPESVGAALGQTVTFTVVAENVTKYQWQSSKDDGSTWSNISASSTTFSGSKTDTLSFTMKSARLAEQYRCVLTGASDTKTTDVVTAGNPVPPDEDLVEITQQPEDVEANNNTTVTFTVVANNATGYQWWVSKNEGESWSKLSATSTTYSGTTTNELSFTMKPTRLAEQFKCVVSGNGGPVESNVVRATHPVPAIVITTQPVDVNASTNTTVTFTVVAENVTGYQWMITKNDGATWSKISATSTVFSGSQTNELSFTMKSARLSEQYKCVLTNSKYTDETVVVRVTNEPVDITGIELDKTEAIMTVGNTLTLTASPIPATIAVTTAWASDNEAVATVADGVVTAVAEGTATITVTMTSDAGTVKEATCAVTVYPDNGATAADLFTYSTDGKITGYIGTEANITLPMVSSDGQMVTGIAAEAFKGNTTIATVVVPDYITVIGDSAFENCTSLTEATIQSNSLTVIPASAFANCTLLSSVVLPNSVQTISYRAFYNCTSLCEMTTIG